MRAMKFETARIQFLGDAFCCCCRRRCLSSLIKESIKTKQKAETVSVSVLSQVLSLG